MLNVNVEDLLKRLYKKAIILTSITIFQTKLLILQAPLIIDRKTAALLIYLFLLL